ncbi:hypothetical protein M125_0898 [Bacteroides fragilis str. 3998T(B)3]|uniref:Uncharacterized protein n=1 Tax=Bacteroides fragilis str. 3998T(B)3 TaxID=1339316 RepID=A0A015U6A1_BACFG|nr:hypothetical protein M125_0898 [Bacteroides fragilis str. 3998T(B)3]
MYIYGLFFLYILFSNLYSYKMHFNACICISLSIFHSLSWRVEKYIF